MSTQEVLEKYKLTGQKTGRPTKLNQELVDNIAKLMRQSNYFETACWACGLYSRLGFLWLERGEKDYKEEKETIFANFFHSIKKAEAEAEATDLSVIMDGPINWTARAWIRERRARERWARPDVKQKVELTGSVPVQIEFIMPGDAKLKEKAKPPEIEGEFREVKPKSRRKKKGT